MGALVGVALAVWSAASGDGSWVLTGAVMALWFGASAGSYLYTTRVGKLRVWRELLDGAGLRGDERVLDVGCGRGAVLLTAASRLTTGTATGVDLWSTKDQSGNAEEVTRQNAEALGVSERVRLVTGDVRQLPFDDGAFDLIVSSLALHNIPDAAGRAQAVDEIYRVLAPGGRVLLGDFQRTSEYAQRLTARGADGVQTRGLGWRFWYGGPYAATKLVSVPTG